jgi:hypothetical protein
MGRKISDFPKREFSQEIIDNCFYVDNPYAPTYVVPVRTIFSHIIEMAKEEGLDIEIINDNRIVINKKS